jgi:CHAD domain-containing protein
VIAPRVENVRASILADHLRLIGELERAARQARRRSDERAVHDVRVATRRLESALDLLKPVTRRRTRRRARRALRSLRRSLAVARDMQIAVGLLSDRLGELPPAARVLSVQFQERLKQRLSALERRASRVCGRREIDDVRRRFERVWRQPLFEGASEETLLEAAHARQVRRRARADAAIRDAVSRPDAEAEALHGARVHGKRWRYVLERHAAVTGDADRAEQRWLKQIQDALGALQDLSNFRERMSRMSRRAMANGASPAAVRALLESCDAGRGARLEEFRRLALSGDRGRKPPPEAAVSYQAS